MGLIDVLTQYDTKKKAAHAAKAVKHGVSDQSLLKVQAITQDCSFTSFLYTLTNEHGSLSGAMLQLFSHAMGFDKNDVHASYKGEL